MNVIVHLGEPFWRAAGQRELAVALGEDATVSDALHAVGQRHPALAADLDGAEVTPLVFVGDEEARSDSRLTEGAKIHVVWPVSGGSFRSHVGAACSRDLRMCRHSPPTAGDALPHTSRS